MDIANVIIPPSIPKGEELKLKEVATRTIQELKREAKRHPEKAKAIETCIRFLKKAQACR